jgi:hypothetical protein
MAIAQNTYDDIPAVGYAGMVANGETSNRISRTIQDVAGIGFGKAAFRGTGDHDCTATPTAGDLLGITIAHEVLGILAGESADVFPRYSNVPIMTLGVIWVLTAVAVNDKEQAYVTPAGAFTNSSSGNVILPGWFFDTSTAAAGLAKLAKR